MLHFVLPLICFLSIEAREQSYNVFPKSLSWENIVAYKDSEMHFAYSEQEFIELFDGRPVTLIKAETERSFDCPVDAVFWFFNNQLETNSHCGNTELKKLLKSKIK